MGKISVIVKEPGKTPRHVNISDSLENLQKAVGGYIECVTLASDLVAICDEEGRVKGKPHCCDICGIDFCGTVILAGVEDDEFADIPHKFADYKRLFPGLWRGC